MNPLKKAKLVEEKYISRDIKKIVFEFENKQTFIPGQFYIVSHNQNGYIVEREYSIANKINSEKLVELGVQIIPNGVVSTYLHSLKNGDIVYLKGPIGKFFNFETTHNGPFVFIAGGSGIVPFMSMIRSYNNINKTLIASFKTKEDIAYFDELKSTDNLDLTITLTQDLKSDWTGRLGRINVKTLKKIIKNKNSLIYVCGRTSFVEDISLMLEEIGISIKNIRTERFG